MFLVATVGRAHADGGDPRGGRAAYREGTREYDLGRYEQAAAKFEEAYRLGGDPRYLFNIGQACWKAKKYEQAKIAYESFLREQPDALNRPLVEQRLVEIARLREPVVVAPPPEPPALPALPLTPVATSVEPRPASPRASFVAPAPAVQVTTPPAAETPVYGRWWFWTAVGAVLVAGGATVAVLARRQKDAPGTTLGKIGPGGD